MGIFRADGSPERDAEAIQLEREPVVRTANEQLAISKSTLNDWLRRTSATSRQKARDNFAEAIRHTSKARP
jgi:hypothetical protein